MSRWRDGGRGAGGHAGLVPPAHQVQHAGDAADEEDAEPEGGRGDVDGQPVGAQRRHQRAVVDVEEQPDEHHRDGDRREHEQPDVAQPRGAHREHRVGDDGHEDDGRAELVHVAPGQPPGAQAAGDQHAGVEAAPHRGAAHADALCDLQHRQALAGAQDDARPLDVLVRAVPVSDESREALTITGVEEGARGLGHAPRLAHLCRTVNPQIASVHGDPHEMVPSAILRWHDDMPDDGRTVVARSQ